ncbi:MAG: hypothetical protein A2270_06260 [Elusimicrobia bacterium RIFOXYA12_FULL_51_18]|nr:MAG: hypothetical protein A2270_06260 [Elusimicrobia bacterium RIFOXYA12_FULL_51_18]OGS31073.1 MAG: hypothetical protein A2218_01900 [Elusimicrobia bacterium RIFOXYA2_FULL_53_38]
MKGGDEKKGDADKGGSFLSSLGKIRRGGTSQEAKPAPSLPPKPVAPPSSPPSSQIMEMKAHIEDLERKLREKENNRDAAAPSRFEAFFQAKTAELERKLYEVQEKALSATLELKSREEAQHKATKEAEDLFKTIKDNQRSGEHDRWIGERLEKLEALCGELKAGSSRREEDLDRLKKEVSSLPAELDATVRLNKLEAMCGDLKTEALRRDAEGGRLKEKLADLPVELNGRMADKSRDFEIMLVKLEQKLEMELESRLNSLSRKMIPLESGIEGVVKLEKSAKESAAIVKAGADSFKVFFDNLEMFKTEFKSFREIFTTLASRVAFLEDHISNIVHSSGESDVSIHKMADTVRSLAVGLEEAVWKINSLSGKADRNFYELRDKVSELEVESRRKDQRGR